MAETLFLSGDIQRIPHEVRCDLLGMDGSAAVQGWLLSETGGVYDFAAVQLVSDAALRRLFDTPPRRLLYVDETTTAPAPVMDRIAPASIEAGGADVELHVLGSGFCPRSVILFNGGAETTTFVSTTELTTTIVGTTATTPGAYPVQVETPGPGGGVSVGRLFHVVSPETITIKQCDPSGVQCWEVPV